MIPSFETINKLNLFFEWRNKKVPFAREYPLGFWEQLANEVQSCLEKV
jgi:hypothetical protein